MNDLGVGNRRLVENQSSDVGSPYIAPGHISAWGLIICMNNLGVGNRRLVGDRLRRVVASVAVGSEGSRSSGKKAKKNPGF